MATVAFFDVTTSLLVTFSVDRSVGQSQVLRPEQTLEEIGLYDGSVVTAIRQPEWNRPVWRTGHLGGSWKHVQFEYRWDGWKHGVINIDKKLQ